MGRFLHWSEQTLPNTMFLQYRRLQFQVRISRTLFFVTAPPSQFYSSRGGLIKTSANRCKDYGNYSFLSYHLIFNVRAGVNLACVRLCQQSPFSLFSCAKHVQHGAFRHFGEYELLSSTILDQRFSTPVLAPPRSAHFACLCCLNTPDSDHQLIRRKFHE